MKINENIQLLKALADPSRLAILNTLLEKPQYVEEISNRIGLAESTVSFHLKKLEEANLVSKTKEQYYYIFEINDKIFNLTLKNLLTFENVDNILQEERIKKYEEKIKKTFFKKGKLIKIPVQLKKKLVILGEICKKFEYDRIYPEKEIDEIISEICDDYCSIRRHLIDHKYFIRSKGNYKLIKKINYKTNNLQNINHNNINNSKENKMTDKNINKKELKNQYKQTEIPMGIYQIRNLTNGKIFIGCSRNLKGILNRRKMELRNGMKFGNIDSSELQADWNKYGEENFVFEEIDYFKPKKDEFVDIDEELKGLLELWLEKLQPFDEKGYNKK